MEGQDYDLGNEDDNGFQHQLLGTGGSHHCLNVVITNEMKQEATDDDGRIGR